ncbi:MAG: molybdopterin-dependent oxidoreductase [Desulfopila sp.]
MAEQTRVYKKTTCPLDCPDTCGLVATVENGRVVALNGDMEHPHTRGVICRKMKKYPERLYSPDRILSPMKRSGTKGQGVFEKISWPEAYGLLADKITTLRQKYGGETILPFVYAGNMGGVNRFAGYPLFHKLGTSRLIETICSTAAKAGWKSQCGDVPGTPPEVAEDAEVIVIWGSNTKVTNMHFWPYVARARKMGAKLVVIDPYTNATSASADLHIKIAPGCDAALALALIKRLGQKQALDTDFVELATSGFADLEEYLERFSLNHFADKSGVAPEQIEQLAAMLAGYGRTFIRIGIGMTRNSRAGLNVRAITSLAAALGLFDGQRGRGVLLSSAAFNGDQAVMTWPSLADKETRRFNMVQLGNSLRAASPPVKMLFVYNANPLSVAPDGSLVRQALEDEELFTVVHEHVMTPTARYADVLLPATTFLENRDIYTAYGHFYMAKADPVIAPCGEAKSNFTFFQELAAYLGFDDPPFQQTEEQKIANYLATLQGLPERVRTDGLPAGQAVLSTRSNGGPQFGDGSNRFAFCLDDDPLVPRHACITDGGEFDDADYLIRYPFKLITPPHVDLLNSTFGERHAGNPGEAMIHPSDAQQYTIAQDSIVTLYNDRGWCRRIARVTEATQEGLIVAEGIFWRSEEHPAGINDLTSQKLTDMGGGGTFHESRVAILTGS